MAVTGKLYSPWLKAGQLSANPQTQVVDLLSDAIKVMLKTSTWTISQTGDSVYTTTNEVTGTAYSAGGATLGSKTYSTSSLTTTFDGADTSWTTATIATAAQAHVYDSTTTTKWLIGYQDFGGTQQVVANDLVIVWNASGIFTLAVT